VRPRSTWHAAACVCADSTATRRRTRWAQSRIFREAYFEGAAYVPMLRRAYELWRELERETATRLLLQTGGLMFGRPDSELVAGTRASAEQCGLEHEVLGVAQIARRFPAFRPEPDMVAVYEPRGCA